MLRELVSMFANVIIHSMFINPSGRHKKAHILSKILFIGLTTFAFYTNPTLGILFFVEFFLIFFISTKSILEPMSMVLLAAIPAFWMAMSGLIIMLFSPNRVTFTQFLLVLYKTLYYSFTAAFTVNLITPVDIASILRFFTKKITYPYLVWLLVPFQMEDAIISLKIQQLKGYSVSSSIFVVFAEQLEKAEQLLIANYHRLESDIVKFVKTPMDRNFTILLLILSLINSSLLIR